MDSKQVNRLRVLGLSFALCLSLAFSGPYSPAQRHLQIPAGGSPSASLFASQAGLDRAAQSRITASYGKLPLTFEANQGQTDPRVKFLARGSGYTLFLTSTEAVLALRDPAKQKEAGVTTALGATALRMGLVGANSRPQVNGVEALPGKSNYLIGKDPKKWRTNVPNYAQVRYEGVYPGVDLVFYGPQGPLEYDFVVAPGADPNLIGFELRATRVHGRSLRERTQAAAQPQIAANGDLVLKLGDREIRFHKPVVYQPEAGSSSVSQSSLLEGHYKLTGRNRVTFALGPYDPTKPLVIDPVLTYSSYLGGNGVDRVYGVAVTPGGNATVVGDTSSLDFPTVPGALQSTQGGGGLDSFVTQFSADGSSLVFSTYLGGNDDDEAWGVGFDSSQNVYLSGFTASLNFPTTSNAYRTTFNGTGHDAFLAKLDPNGASLLYSTYIAPV
jgi:hypothetical protein